MYEAFLILKTRHWLECLALRRRVNFFLPDRKKNATIVDHLMNKRTYNQIRTIRARETLKDEEPAYDFILSI